MLGVASKFGKFTRGLPGDFGRVGEPVVLVGFQPAQTVTDDDTSAEVIGSVERRNDNWRWWDFFWMFHNMDYADRTSFNHPLIITAGIAMAWLAVTGFWLLFRTIRRHDFVWLRARRTRQA